MITCPCEMNTTNPAKRTIREVHFDGLSLLFSVERSALAGTAVLVAGLLQVSVFGHFVGSVRGEEVVVMRWGRDVWCRNVVSASTGKADSGTEFPNDSPNEFSRKSLPNSGT